MTPAPDVREPSPRFTKWFCRYAQNRLRRDFHRLRLLGAAPSFEQGPLVVYANHSSWWDPMVALAIRPIFFPERDAYAPIAAEMLERYGIFKKLGFFGVDRETPRGVIRYLRAVEDVLSRPGAMLYLTPQGRFADVRERPPTFQRGIGHVAQRVGSTQFLPMALEFVFWEESKPEILLHFGPLQRFDPGMDRNAAQRALERAMERAQDELAEAAIQRDPARFQSVLEGSAGVGGIYDLWRRLRARFQGRSPELEHGEL